MIVSFSDGLPAKVPTYRDLPKAIRRTNQRLTGEALARGGARFSEYELRDFVKNLDGCNSGVVPYVVNGRALALSNRNMRPGHIKELFRRLGIDDIWVLVASIRTLQRWSGPGGAKNANAQAKARLEQLIENRTQIAHRVGSTTVGPQSILNDIRFSQSLAKVIDNHAASL